MKDIFAKLFERTLFSGIGVKDIFARVISPFRNGFIFTKLYFAKIKPS